MKKKPLTPEQEQECRGLKLIWEDRRRERGLTQQSVADAMGDGVTQGAVSHYLNGKNALNLEAALVFSRLLGVPLERFSSRLAAQLRSMRAGHKALPETEEISQIMADLSPEDRKVAVEIFRAYANRGKPEKS